MIYALSIAIAIIFLLSAAACYGAYFMWRQGDSDIVLLTDYIEAPELSGLTGSATISRSLVFKNRGTQDGVLLDVRVSADRTPGLLVEPSVIRMGTNPTELNYWVANIMEPGYTCEGNLTVQISAASPGAIARSGVIPLNVSYEEVGRSLLVTKEKRLNVVVPAIARTE